QRRDRAACHAPCAGEPPEAAALRVRAERALPADLRAHPPRRSDRDLRLRAGRGRDGEMTGRDEAYWAKPVRSLTVRTVPAAAVNANVAGRRGAGAGQGFGQRWDERRRGRLDGA